jgi:hypothetical protein
MTDLQILVIGLFCVLAFAGYLLLVERVRE